MNGSDRKTRERHTTRGVFVAALVTVSGVGGFAIPGGGTTQVPTTLEDFFQPGSQPTGGAQYAEFVTSGNCKLCHEFQYAELGEDPEHTVIYREWHGSMMAQAARDPLFYACLAIANQDAAFAGDLCLRCHTAAAWLGGRSEPTDGSALLPGDRDGVSCSVCHRIVDPVLKPESPFQDQAILANIDPLPISPGGGSFIMDPEDYRRGPFGTDDGVVPLHQWLESPFHKTSELCATCHDVSNPAYVKQEDGSYALSVLDAAHPTGDKHDMFPIERTYSEWLHSDFATVGVDMGGRFGGNKQVVSTCQDCHMQDTTGRGCSIQAAPIRDDLPSHQLAGGNAWVQDMVWNLYGDQGIIADDGLNYDYLMLGKAAAESMLQRAATLELSQLGNHANVRIINETGHKLPTGYPEGRRMWINVEFYDDAMNFIEDRGFYDTDTAELFAADTKVYEAHLAIAEAVSALTGIPTGAGFHFALNNVVLKDNRIPPRGFSNAAYESVGAAPVAANYVDGQFWDDSAYRMPRDTHRVEVRLYYQTASKEYITFLRDANVTNDAGDILYDQWQATGMSPPVLMAGGTLLPEEFADGDFDGNGVVDWIDHFEWTECETAPGGSFVNPDCWVFDYDEDGDVDLLDYREFLLSFNEP